MFVIVDPKSVRWLSTLEGLSYVYGAVRELYPKALSLHVTSGSIWQLLVNGEATLQNVKAVASDNS